VAFEAEAQDQDLQGVEEALEEVLVDVVDFEVGKDLFSTVQELPSKKNSMRISK
jgi:hypothetical protein